MNQELPDIQVDLEKAEELYKKGFNNPDNHDGMVTHLKPDILEPEAK